MEEGLTPEAIGFFVSSIVSDEERRVLASLYRQSKSIEGISSDTHFTVEKVKKILGKLAEKELVGKR